MRLAYADPPYPGQSAKHYGAHPEYRGEVDWQELAARLDRRFDGFALSVGAKWLHQTLSYFRDPKDLRVLAWVKPQVPPFPDVITYSWEPVILYPARRPRRPVPRDSFIGSHESYQYRAEPEGYVIGAKPPGFCRWLFECLGADRDDEFHDLFPGSGGVTEAWRAWRDQPELPHPEIPRNTRRAQAAATMPLEID